MSVRPNSITNFGILWLKEFTAENNFSCRLSNGAEAKAPDSFVISGDNIPLSKPTLHASDENYNHDNEDNNDNKNDDNDDDDDEEHPS